MLPDRPDLFGWPEEVAVFSVVPNRSLRDHVSAVEFIAATIERFDDEQLIVRYDKLGAALISELAGSCAKVDSCARVLAMFEARSLAARAERDRLDKRVKYYDRQSERLEAYVLRVLDEAKLERRYRGRNQHSGNASATRRALCPTQRWRARWPASSCESRSRRRGRRTRRRSRSRSLSGGWSPDLGASDRFGWYAREPRIRRSADLRNACGLRFAVRWLRHRRSARAAFYLPAPDPADQIRASRVTLTIGGRRQ